LLAADSLAEADEARKPGTASTASTRVAIPVRPISVNLRPILSVYL